MDTDLYKAVMEDNMRYFNDPTHDRQSIPCQATSQNQNVLHIAADFKRIDLARNLVALFPLLLTRADLRGNTPLHIASKRGCSEMVACFLESEVAESALEKTNEMDDTALHVAVRNGDLEVVKLLVQKNSMLLDLVNKQKESPLYLAVVRGFFEIAEFMLKEYSHVCSCEGTKGTTALHAAVIHTHKGTYVRESELSGENSHKPEREIFLSICLSGIRFQDEIDILKLLLEKKKDAIRQVDEFGWSPLHYAAQLGHHEAAKKLLPVDHGYVAGLCDDEQSCAIHIAAKNGHSDVIQEILAWRPDVYNLVDYKRRTILHIAAQFGKDGVVKYILKDPKLESLINEPDDEGNTALHLAGIHRHYCVVETLAADNRVDKRAMNNKYLKTIDILQSDVDDGSPIVLRAMKNLKHTDGQSFHHFVIREQTDLQNGDGVSHTACNMISKHCKRKGEVMKEEEPCSHRLKDLSHINLVVGALIATVTFQAGLSPPGGLHDEGHHKSEAVLSTDKTFKDFLTVNGIAFYSSTAALLLSFIGSLFPNNCHRRLLLAQISAFLIYYSFLYMMVAFSYSFYFALPSNFPWSTIVLGVFEIVVFISLLSRYLRNSRNYRTPRLCIKDHACKIIL